MPTPSASAIPPVDVRNAFLSDLTPQRLNAFAVRFHALAVANGWKWGMEVPTLEQVHGTVRSLVSTVYDCMYMHPDRGHWSCSMGRICVVVEFYAPRSVVVHLTCDISA